MKILLAFLVGFLFALALFLLSTPVRELANRGRQRLYLWQLRLLAWTMPPALMALPADIPARNTGMPYSGPVTILTEWNKLIVQLRVLCTKLDNDAGVTDVNYNALVMGADAASPAKITQF